MGSCLTRPKGKAVDSSVRTVTKNVLLERSATNHKINGAVQISKNGVRFRDQNKFAEARLEFETCLKIFEEENPNSLNLALTFENLALTYECEHKHSEAVTNFKKAMDICQSVAPEKVPNYHLKLGVNFRKQSKFNEALFHLNKAIEGHRALNPRGEDLAISYNTLGLMLQEQGKWEEALLSFNKALAVYELSGASQTVVALSIKVNVGSIMARTGKLAEALEMSEKLAVELKAASAGAEIIAAAYNNVASVMLLQGRCTEALEQLKNVTVIIETSLPNSMSLATAKINTGALYKSTDRLSEALDQFQTAVALLLRIAPNTVTLGVAYKHMGDTYLLQKDYVRAKEFNAKALAILSSLVPGSAYEALTLSSLGDTLLAEGFVDDALLQYHRAMTILEKAMPNTVVVARVYYNVGVVYRKQQNYNESLEVLMKAYSIRNRELVASHPDLVQLCYELAEVLLMLCEYEQGLQYADMAIAKDARYKFAYKVKGLLLNGQDKFTEALQCFDTALEIDPGYADAQLFKIDTLILVNKALAEQSATTSTGNSTTVDTSALEKELSTAATLQKSDFDEQYRQELVAKALSAGDQNVKIVLPPAEYEAGSASLLQKVEEMRAEVASLRVTVDEHSRQLQTIFKRLDILDNLVYSLAHSMKIIKANVTDVNNQIADLKRNDPNNNIRLQELLAEKEKLVIREKHIKEINKQPDLRQYYHTLLSEIEAAYIAAQAIASGQVDMTPLASSNVSKAASYLSTVATLVPMVGHIASAVISKAGKLYDVYYQTNIKLELARIRDLASTVDEFDRIAVRIAVALTLRNKATIEALQGAVMPKDMKFYASIFVKQCKNERAVCLRCLLCRG